MKKICFVLIKAHNKQTADIAQAFVSEMNADAFLQGWAEKTFSNDDFEEIGFIDDGWFDTLQKTASYHGYDVDYLVDIPVNHKFK